MVKHLHVPVDDSTFDRLEAAKNRHGGTWEELIVDSVLSNNTEDN